jgi:hypothetical protein
VPDSGNMTGGSSATGGNSATGGTTATGGSSSACVSGSTQSCVGPGNCQGAQSCSSDGSGWGACDCGGDGGTDDCGDSDTCEAYCNVAADNCTSDDSFEICVASCRSFRCGDASACRAQYDAWIQCTSDGGSICVVDRSRLLGDCRDKGSEFATCMGYTWRCTGSGPACFCQRSSFTGGSPTCTNAGTCCSVALAGNVCDCHDQEECSAQPGFVLTDSCPPV